MALDLTDFPEFRALGQLCQALKAELMQLRETVREALPEYVDQVEAERLTGLSRTTLYRERRDPQSIIKSKNDRGVRYLRASLIDHNKRRAEGPGYSRGL